MTEIRMHNGRPAIYIDGKVCPETIAFIRTRTRENGELQIHFNSEYFKKLSESGVNIFLISCNTEWLQPDALEIFDREARMLLEAAPNAYIIPRFGLHAPVQWCIDNPDACIRWSDGSYPSSHLFTESYEEDYPLFYSLSSQKWREAAGKALVNTWKKLLALPYAERIIGCFPTAGHTSEWRAGALLTDDANHRCLDYGEGFRQDFSEYLREKYHTDEALQKAVAYPHSNP